MTQTIEIVSDVVCPWCFIGKRRLAKALKLMGNPSVEIRWKPFQLNPEAPPEGFDRQAYRTRKFGSAAYSRQLEARVAAAGEGEGILFQFDRIAKTPNTLPAHRLIWLAGQDGGQDALVESLFQAYFLNGEDIGDPSVLKQRAAESGLKPERIAQVLDGSLGAAEVAAEEDRGRLYGIEGVPAFIINGALVISGAQPPETMAAAFGRFVTATPSR